MSKWQVFTLPSLEAGKEPVSVSAFFFVVVFTILVVHRSECVAKYVVQITGIPSIGSLKWVKWHQEESWPNVFHCLLVNFFLNQKILLGTDQSFFKQDCSRLNKNNTNITMQGLLVLEDMLLKRCSLQASCQFAQCTSALQKA